MAEPIEVVPAPACAQLSVHRRLAKLRREVCGAAARHRRPNWPHDVLELLDRVADELQVLAGDVADASDALCGAEVVLDEFAARERLGPTGWAALHQLAAAHALLDTEEFQQARHGPAPLVTR